jgi:glycosyltransferase involved in cell wall biosynthesis
VLLEIRKVSVQNQPFVSVLTPTYNLERFLAECIESVLNQTYTNFEYIIVNNCSTDGTQELVERYARLDRRIRIYRNDQLLPIIANHNKAFSLMAPGAKYCKILSGDDWLFPECLAKMVELAEANPSVGLVGSYQLSGGGADWRRWRVRWDELPYPSPVVPGIDFCRRYLMGGPYVFGTPTSTLYRADLVRRDQEFYPNSSAEADTSACIRSLSVSDFGFVHQVLSYERVHQGQITTTSKSLHAYALAKLRDLLTYGPLFMSTDEIARRRDELLDSYYAVLATSVVGLREKAFWAHHRKSLEEIGYPLQRGRLAKAVMRKLLDLVLNPKQTAEKVMQRAGVMQRASAAA